MVSSRCLQDATMNITDAWKHLLILTKISVAEEKFNALSDLLQYVNLVSHSCFFFLSNLFVWWPWMDQSRWRLRSSGGRL